MVVEPKQRTIQQNKSLHKYFSLLADELNLAGYDMKRTLKPGIEIPWNGDTIKDYIWRPIQQAQLGKESTRDLTTKEIDTVFDTLNRHLGEKLGVHVPFPSLDEILNEQRVKERS